MVDFKNGPTDESLPVMKRTLATLGLWRQWSMTSVLKLEMTLSTVISMSVTLAGVSTVRKLSIVLSVLVFKLNFHVCNPQHFNHLPCRMLNHPVVFHFFSAPFIFIFLGLLIFFLIIIPLTTPRKELQHDTWVMARENNWCCKILSWLDCLRGFLIVMMIITLKWPCSNTVVMLAGWVSPTENGVKIRDSEETGHYNYQD